VYPTVSLHLPLVETVAQLVCLSGCLSIHSLVRCFLLCCVLHGGVCWQAQLLQVSLK
jgi:hypothetical protein